MMHETGHAMEAQWLEDARAVLRMEASAIDAVAAALNGDFCRAVQAILQLDGRLVVLGMGKSGIIAQKVAATFASTGTPAFFVHAAEAQHGDLGMITRQDAVLAFSHSGETAEVIGLLPVMKRMGIPMIAVTGSTSSSLARHADMVLHVDVSQEACPMNLAPTASTTAALALGDALAVVVLQQRGFSQEDFALFHPAGSLGRKLMRVEELMHKGSALPMVASDAPLKEAIMTMSSHRLGVTGVQHDGQLVGCLTDGDLRRILESGHLDLMCPVAEVMHRRPKTIVAGHLASEAVHLMEETKITTLFVLDADGGVRGVVHLHDLLQAGEA
ncbi:MAG: D-arabinose 5-phosphate isomerase [Zetaproteobacteria bacterium CG1_02_55_237]|nr:MAG: D-arabinose 5-phosphate isomerase [Zetaproteobacteria bacterium CG1_02_55_237]